VSKQYSIVNGRMSQQTTYAWVLQPTKVGRAEVGAVRVGDSQTAPITVDVEPGRVRPRATPRPDPFGEDPFESFFGRRRPERVPDPKLFMEARPSRVRLHVGEPVVITYFLYTQTAVTDLQFADAPQYPGFWAEELPRPKEPPNGEAATVEGDRYRRLALVQKLLFPTRAGALTIPGSTVRLGVPRSVGFFGDTIPTVVERKIKPITINVDPVPDEPGFTGAVGSFRVSAALDREAVALGEAATLRFRVEGSGNLKWIERGPELALAGAKVYPPQVKSDVSVSPSGMTGAKTWEFVVVPETSGVVDVPGLVFSYFDPRQGRIVRAETSPLALRVGAGAAAGPAPAATRPARAGGLALRSELDLPGTARPWSARALVIVIAVVLIAHAALWIGPTLLERRRPASSHAGRRGARHALAELAAISRAAANKETAAARIEKALHDAFGPLENGDAPSEGERAARAVLDEVSFLRYAPQLGDYSEKIREVAARASEVVRRWA
jgi:hypothetical protein